MDKSVWREIEPIGDFLQRDPDPGQPPTERTSVRIAYTSAALYIAVRCYDRQPEGIRATQMARDASLDSDDRIEIVLDTYDDRRNAYYFATNAVGALVDRSGGGERRAGAELGRHLERAPQGQAGLDRRV